MVMIPIATKTVASLILSLVVAVTNADVPYFGFPRCYTSFDDYDTNFVDDRPNHETRPIVGAKRLPYTGGSAEACTNDVVAPLIAVGPHWSPIGVTQYFRSSNDTCVNCLPDEFANGTLIVASHGSWNRAPYIGYRVHAYEVEYDDEGYGEYSVASQQTLLPPLRNSETGNRLRPVDVKSSPVDDALLMTADQDDVSGSGGVYRIRGAAEEAVVGENAPTAVDFSTQLNALGENPANVVLERLASIPYARQMAISTGDPTLVYVSTMIGFAQGGDTIWVLRLDADKSEVVNGPVRLVEGLNVPQGIDTFTETTTSTLYIATAGTLPTNRGNSILELEDVDSLAYEALGIDTGVRRRYLTSSFPLDGRDCNVVKTLVKDYTALQITHSWRSLRVHPSGAFAIVSIGADCNWSDTCTDNSSTNLHASLLRVGLSESDRGRISIAASGVRNSIGFHFFEGTGDMVFTSMGSDDAAGIPGASSSNNLPDCAVEVLRFVEGAEIDYIPIAGSFFFLNNLFDLINSAFVQFLSVISFISGGIVID